MYGETEITVELHDEDATGRLFFSFCRGADEEREKRLFQEMEKHRNRDTFNQMVKVPTGASYIVTFWMRPLSSTMKHTLSASR